MFEAIGKRRVMAILVAVLATVALAAGAMVATAAEDTGGGARDTQAVAKAAAKRSETRNVLAVSNNWDGTVDLVDPESFERLKRLNVVPDREERETEIATNPVDLAFFLAIRTQIGEGHDQLADDAFTSPNGRFIYVSRPSFKDVVALDMDSEEIVWRLEVDGQRSDHMAISKNGKRLLVSASTANKVHVIDTEAGEFVDEFESGDSPHENNFSKDGERIFHASIGMVYTPLDQPEFDTSKGERYFQIVDSDSMEILKRKDMGQVLEDAGYPDMSAAVRPMTLSPDERFVYFQVSFFHGFIEYDLQTDTVRRVALLPQSEKARNTPREQYLLDSAHHGIAMNPKGTKLCVAGTMSDYAAIVSRQTLRHKTIELDTEEGEEEDGAKPYWSTPSEDGRYCFVSVSGEDRVAVISFDKEREVDSFPVGDHPQRMRTGKVRRAIVR